MQAQLTINHSSRFAILLLVLLGACGRSENARVASDAISRRLVGPALAYDPPDISDPNSITSSLRATRALAWDVFAQVVTRSDYEGSKPDGSPFASTLPRVFTWYGTEDVNRLMTFTFKSAPNDELLAGIPVSEPVWKDAEERFNKELDSLPLPLQKKWARFFDGPTEEANLVGSTGLNRMIFSPDLIQSLTRRYAELQDCFPAAKLPAPLLPAKRCWAEALPRSSVLVKTAWIDAQSKFPKFATDTENLRSFFAKERANWADIAVPSTAPSNIVSAKSGDKTFVLGGLHIVTKDLDDWLWISAWWSENPESDFGEDRPASVKALGAPWNQYKICAVSSYVQDPAELKEMAKTHPSLAAAYEAVLGTEGLSWCSNPYIEKGDHNPRTNCIGCHQFAGTDVDQAEILSDAERFPHFGRSKQREDFPTDYIWTATKGSQPWLDTLQSQLFFRQPRADVKP